MSDPMPAVEPCPGSNLPPRDPAQADGDGTCATCGRLVRVRWGRTAQHKRPSTAKGAGERSAGNAAADSARPLLFYAALSQLRPSPANPRTRMDEESLRELADSIKQDGVLEPLVVRYITDAQGIGSYELIAGHRRLAAARLAGLDAVPVVVRRDVDDVAALRLALVENLQRRDLDPLDEAQGYRRLQELGWKQAQIAEAVHRKAPTIANALRLLDLPDEVRQLIREGQLSASHGRALAALKDFPAVCGTVAAQAVANGWTTHALESGAWASEYGTRQHLLGAGAAQELQRWGTPFYEQCQQCPFGAFRRISDYNGLCLKPEHYAELNAEAERQAREALAQQQEAAAERAGLSGKDPEEIRRHLADLAARGDEAYAERQRQEKADRRRGHKRDIEQLVQLVDAIDQVGVNELALMGAAVLGHLGRPVAVKEAGRHAGGLVDLSNVRAYNGTERIADFARLDRIDLVRLIVEAVLRSDLADMYQGYAGATPLAWWYAGLGKPAAWQAQSLSPEREAALTAAAFGADGTPAAALDEVGLRGVLDAHATFGEAHRAAHEGELVDVGDGSEQLAEVAG